MREPRPFSLPYYCISRLHVIVGLKTTLQLFRLEQAKASSPATNPGVARISGGTVNVTSVDNITGQT